MLSAIIEVSKWGRWRNTDSHINNRSILFAMPSPLVRPFLHVVPKESGTTWTRAWSLIHTSNYDDNPSTHALFPHISIGPMEKFRSPTIMIELNPKTLYFVTLSQNCLRLVYSAYIFMILICLVVPLLYPDMIIPTHKLYATRSYMLGFHITPNHLECPLAFFSHANQFR